MATSREMTEGRALPLIFNFTLPLLLGNLLQQTYSLDDPYRQFPVFLSGYVRPVIDRLVVFLYYRC